MPSENPLSLYPRIYAWIKQVPPGYVCSYAMVGKLVGCSARTVGFALAALPAQNDVPWHRVVNSMGKVSIRGDEEGHVLQRDLLESEGVCFSENNSIDLYTYGWTFK